MSGKNQGDRANSKQSSSAAHLRKVSKPMVERRRRERINRSIDELKTLLVRQRQMIGATRMDKTEILELAVDELRNLSQTSNRTCERLPKEDVAYSAGYNACAEEALRQIGEMHNVSLLTRQRLADRLGEHLRRTCSVIAHDDVKVTSVSSPPTNDAITLVVPRRRLFDAMCLDEGDQHEGREKTLIRSSRRHRRPLAEIQSSAFTDGSRVCPSMPTSSFTAADKDRSILFPFPCDLSSCNGSTMVEYGQSPSLEVVSRRVTVTQTMTTTDRRQTTNQRATSNHFEFGRNFLPAAAKLEPMWRPW